MTWPPVFHQDVQDQIDLKLAITDASGTYETVFIVPTATGVAATDTAAWTTAINAAIAAGRGKVVPRGGGYVINAALPQITVPSVSIIGPGKGACSLSPTSAVTTHVLRWKTNPFTVDQAGVISGLTIDGTNAPAGACGLHMGDVIGGQLDDVVIQNFTGAGSVGLWADNTTNWTERVNMRRVHLDNNSIALRLTVNGGTSSFGYWRCADLRMNVNAGQVGWQIENNATLYSADITQICNASGASPTLFKVMNTAIVNGRAFIACEGGSSAIRFNVAASASVRLAGHVGFPGATDTGTGLLGVGVQQKFAQTLSGTVANSATWQVLGYALTLPASEGDLVVARFTCLVNNDASDIGIDFATLNGGAPVNQFSTNAAMSNSNGGLMVCQGTLFYSPCLVASKRLVSGDILNGTVQVSPVFRMMSGSGRSILGSLTQPARVEITVIPGDLAVV